MDDPTEQLLAMGATLMTCKAALAAALEELASMNGGATGAWLDRLEDAAVNGVKNAELIGLPTQDELEVANASILMLQTIFNDVRERFPQQRDTGLSASSHQCSELETCFTIAHFLGGALSGIFNS